jgi:putative phosphoribosyl transferase
MHFADRQDAGQRLAAILERYRQEAPVVLALPRGGVAIGEKISKALGCPLDIVLVRKIGAPGQPELAVGAVVGGEDPQIVVNDDVMAMLDLPAGFVERAAMAELKEIARRRRLYLGNRPPIALENRTAIVVDDGLATGATARAALRAVRRRHPRHMVLAVPVAPPDAVAMLAPECDAIECLQQRAGFGAIGAFYTDFHQMTDEEVIALLKGAAARQR